MKAFIKTVLFISLCFSSCKKEDPIPNTLYGEWQLTEWIFEGRDITDSIEVIWGKNNRFISEGEIARKRGGGSFYSVINNNKTRAATYEFITDDYNFIGLYMKNSDTLFIADTLAEKYKIATGALGKNKKLFEIVKSSDENFTLYSLYGINKLNFQRL
jgi:hypothetical protein